jgi:hypothetical protein
LLLFIVASDEMKSISPIIALAFLASFYLAEVSPQIILEVPSYGVLNGTTDFSYDAGRLFYAFRSVFYAEKPAPQGRFLVSIIHFHAAVLQLTS